MSFHVLIPARLASTRLPRKPLLDIAGLPMIVRVAQQAQKSQCQRVVVATDTPEIAQVCDLHGVSTVMTDAHHLSGSDRLAQACAALQLPDNDIVVNVQGDEPLIDPALMDACARLLQHQTDCVVSTAAHPLLLADEFSNPNVVKVVCDQAGRALYFSRASIPHWRDAQVSVPVLNPIQAPLRHIGIYAYRVGFLKRFPQLAVSPLEQIESLEQLRVLWHGFKIAVHVAQSDAAPGVDTPADLERVRQRFVASA